MTSPSKAFLSSPKGSNVTMSWKNKHTPKFIPAYVPNPREEYIGSATIQQKLYQGENLEVLGHLLNTKRGMFQLIYADPPFDSVASYKKPIRPLGNNDLRFYQEQYNDCWAQGEYEQFLYERFLIFRDLLSAEGSLYVHCDWHSAHIIRMILDEVFGRENFRNEIIWHHDFGGRGKRFLARKHDNLFLYTKGKTWFFDHESLPFLPYQGNLHKYRGQKKKGKRPTAVWSDLQDFSGLDAVWDIAYENKMSSKNTGYPTQKPHALLERIIRLSCPPQGLILDPFIGSGTTMRVAQSLGRSCIGIDSNCDAIETTRNHLLEQYPQTSLSIASTHIQGAPQSERVAQMMLCSTQQYKMQKNNTAVSEDGELVLFAPLCRICTDQDIERLTDQYRSFFKQYDRIFLWGYSFARCNDSLDIWTQDRRFIIKELPLPPSFHIEWTQKEGRFVVVDIPLTDLRNRLGANQDIVWQQLISSIRIQSQEKSDTIYIGTSKRWVPDTIPLPTAPCTITFTDILSRSTSRVIPSLT